MRIGKTNRNGFSLVELLVVLGITSIVLAAAFSLLLFGNSTFKKGTMQSGVQSEARSALDFVSSELRNAKSIMLTTPANPASYEHIHVANDDKVMFRQAGGTDVSKSGPYVLSSNDLSFMVKKAGNAYVLVSSITTTDGTRNYTITTDTKLNNVKSFSLLDTNYHEIYYLSEAGTFTADSVANTVLSVSQPLQNDGTLVLPSVPSGFSIAIKAVNPTSGPLDVSGAITPPLADTVVYVTFTITYTTDGTTADTAPIAVLIPAKPSLTAASVASAISVMDPTVDSTSIDMPVMPDGFTLAMASSTPTGIIAANGVITFPKTDTKVTLVFTVTRTLDGSKANSSSIEITVPGKVIFYAAPTSLLATAITNDGYGDNHGRITLTWNDNTSIETKFILERSTNSTFTANIVDTDVTANLVTITQTALAKSTTYWYRIKAFGTDGESLWSNTVSAKTPAASVPTPPSSLVAKALSSPDKGKITLTWTDNTTGETKFVLQRARNSTFTSSLVSTDVAANSVTITQAGLGSGIKYYYRINATGSDWTSVWSSTVNATTK